MITTNNYKTQKISIGLIQNKKSRLGKKYQNIPILYDGRKALVHLCGRFLLTPDLSFDVSSGNYDVIDEEGIIDDSFGNSADNVNSCSIAIEVDADNRKLFEDFEKRFRVKSSNQPKQNKEWGRK